MATFNNATVTVRCPPEASALAGVPGAASVPPQYIEQAAALLVSTSACDGKGEATHWLSRVTSLAVEGVLPPRGSVVSVLPVAQTASLSGGAGSSEAVAWSSKCCLRVQAGGLELFGAQHMEVVMFGQCILQRILHPSEPEVRAATALAAQTAGENLEQKPAAAALH